MEFEPISHMNEVCFETEVDAGCSLLGLLLSKLDLLLKSLDAGGLITVVASGSPGTLLKGAEVELLKLDCKLVDLELVLRSFGETDLELNGDDVSERVATWSPNREVDVPNLVHIRNHAWEDREGCSDLD